MATGTEQHQATLAERVQALAAGQPEAVRNFARLFCRGIPPEEQAEGRAAVLYAAALSLAGLAARRRPGVPAIRIFNPRQAEHGWDSRHVVVEIVNDDMPFLVDSVTAALTEAGLGVHLVIHPVAAVRRSADGVLEGLWPVAEAPAGAPRESLMHIEVDQRTTPGLLDEVQQRLAAVLADVRAAVEDWPRMREAARSLANGLQAAPPSPVPADETAEAVALLRWMDDGNFTFLGYREYGFVGEGRDLDLAIRPEGGLGILREPAVSVFEGQRQFAELPAEIQGFMRQPQLVLITKAARRATVHRPVPLDVIIVKSFDEAGEVVGERMFAGLFTSIAYSGASRDIPILRQKVARTLARAGLDPKSHDGKALTHILDTYPRDELFQIGDDELFETATGILDVQDRWKTVLFVRRDPYGRFVSCLVYVPRDRFDSAVVERMRNILEEAYGGPVTSVSTQLLEGVHARVHLLVSTPAGASLPDQMSVERRLAGTARNWQDDLKGELVSARGEEVGLPLWRIYGEAFPTSYREAVSAVPALVDIDRLEQVRLGAPLAVALYRPSGQAPERAQFKLIRAGGPVPLSQVLPMLENMGFLVIAEVSHEVRPAGGEPVWIHDFHVESRDGRAIDIGGGRAGVEEAFRRVWLGEMENDGFNRLVVAAGLEWQQVVVLRAYAKYLRQARLPFSQEAVEATLAAHPAIVRLLVQLFSARLSPGVPDRDEAAGALRAGLEQALEAVENLDEDSILRRMANLVEATLRTSFYQRGADGAPKPTLALKLDSQAVDGLPLPRPWREIFVYSPRVEAVHLRGGRVARGGIRWSDRREDFRTEVLGLMKAQMVKNAVIVPVGSKGGFVVKRPPREGGREALQAEGVECYRAMMRAMLDVTDNLVEGAVVPPADTVRWDGDDPYLVVAADKGTATFSDIANAISADYGFWLGDAFASGGSAGYDHKKMGITARGAWESVKRHFRELGHDTQAEDFTVVGVGDMSGDVFGNAMLLSPHIRLVGAFNHLHIFVDPEPDAAASFKERKRLFALGRGSWDQYDPALLSKGGAVFDRRAKSVRLSPEARARFGIEPESLSPAQLIAALLRADIDLLWFGGIGTYVKARTESHLEVGDKANDALRIDGREVRAKVIGEGANLAMTQTGRIEAAQKGVRLNTDFIDNSAGVDTSDHEVNLKVLLAAEVAAGAMTVEQRDRLLAGMTEEVAALVLRDNYLQSQAISLAAAEAPRLLDVQARFMRALERTGRLDRAVERLPDDETLAERAGRHEGLTRPELALLLSYGKIAFNEDVLAGDLPDDPNLAADLDRYFPQAIRDRHRAAIARHPLRREILATGIVNEVVNRGGPTFVPELRDRSGLGAEEVARAFLIAREAFGLDSLWQAIEGLDNSVPAEEQTRLLLLVGRLLERASAWLLRHRAGDLDIARAVADYAPRLHTLTVMLPELVHEEVRALLDRRVETAMDRGVPEPLARRLAAISLETSGLDIIRIDEACPGDLKVTGQAYFELGRRLGLAWLRDRAMVMPAPTHWHAQAIAAIVEDLYSLQADLTMKVLAGTAEGERAAAILGDWLERRRQSVERLEQLMAELKQQEPLDIAMLAVAARRLRGLAAG